MQQANRSFVLPASISLSNPTNPTHMPPPPPFSPLPVRKPCVSDRVSQVYQQCIFIVFNTYQQTYRKSFVGILPNPPTSLTPCTLHPTLCPGHRPGLPPAFPFPLIDRSITVVVTSPSPSHPPTLIPYSINPSVIRDVWTGHYSLFIVRRSIVHWLFVFLPCMYPSLVLWY